MIKAELQKPDVKYNNLMHKNIELNLQPQVTMINCILQFNSIKTTYLVVDRLYEILRATEKEAIEGNLKKSLKFSKEFNGDVLQRYLLWKNGYLSNTQTLPSLYDFQINTATALLVLHIKNFWHDKSIGSYEKLINFIIRGLRDYVEKAKELMCLTKSKPETQVKYGFFGTNLITEGQNWLVKLYNMIYFQMFPKLLAMLKLTIKDSEKRTIIRTLFGELLNFSS
jgi:hypothetical protein